MKSFTEPESRSRGDDCTSKQGFAGVCRLVSLGTRPVPYDEAQKLQQAAHAARLRGDIPDTVFLLEHEPVVTIGRSARGLDNLRSSAEELIARSIQVVEADRGGDVTYHAPGQLVGYPILDLNDHGRDLHRYLRELEQTLIDVVGDYGIAATTIPGLTGVWVDNKKIAAIGIKVSRWVTMHGFALNIGLDLTPMRRDIVPCGIADRDVTSLMELGVTATRADVEERFAEQFRRKFHCGGVLVESAIAKEMTSVLER